MAKRKKRTRLGAAKKAMAHYLDVGTSKASDAVATFLANFDTAELVAALKKQAQTAGTAAGRKVGLVSTPKRKKRRKTMKTAAKTSAAKRRTAKRK